MFCYCSMHTVMVVSRKWFCVILGLKMDIQSLLKILGFSPYAVPLLNFSVLYLNYQSVIFFYSCAFNCFTLNILWCFQARRLPQQVASKVNHAVLLLGYVSGYDSTFAS